MRHGAITGLAIFGLVLAACGGGGSPGNPASSTAGGNDATTPIDAVGRIDAFGSVFVNGIEFETDSTSFRVDDDDAFDDSALSVGMIVRVKGSHDGRGRGHADEIHYDDEIKGQISNLAVDADDESIKSFTILGTMVVANAATTLFKAEDRTGYTFDDLADGHFVEVSGDFDGDTLIATFIELEDDEDVEVKGTVSSLGGSTFVLTLRDGNTLDVTLGAGVILPPEGLMEGQFVEVEATIPDPAGAPDSLLAIRIEIEDRHDFDDDDDHEASLEGILNLDGDTWTVRMTELQFDSATEFRPSSLETAINDGTADGLRVKVRGDVTDGVLRVERIETEGDDRNGEGGLEVKGLVDSVVTDAAQSTSDVTVSFAPATGTIAVRVDSETLLKNDDGMIGFDISDLVPGSSFVEVHGHIDASGLFVANVLESEDSPDEYEIEGPLDQDGFVEGATISVLGVTFTLDGGTVFDDGLPQNGDVVDVEDFDRDGIADEVDIED